MADRSCMIYSSEAIGGAEGNRTPDLHVANVALSRLSYGPLLFSHRSYGDLTIQVSGIQAFPFASS